MESIIRCIIITISTIIAFLLDRIRDYQEQQTLDYLKCRTCYNERVMFMPDTQRPCKSFVNCLKRNQLPAPKPCTHSVYKCVSYHGWLNEKPCAMAEVLRTLNTARESIYLCMFAFTHDTLSDFLKYLKLERGISVYILTDRLQQHRQENDQILGLKEAGIDVRWNPRAPMHNKYCIVDRRVMISGSANWTHYAFNNNDEMIIWIENPAIVRQVVRKFVRSYRSGSSNLLLF